MASVDTESRKEFGGSLPVENVQHLASTNPNHIPPRYVRPQLLLDEVSTTDSLHIPVIDFNKLLEGSGELHRLHLACAQWGFFQLVNHGVAEEVVEEMKAATVEFFELPLEKKLACSQLPNGLEGYGQAFVVSEEQKLDWGDMLFLFPLPIPLRKMVFWPPAPAFRSAMHDYSAALQQVTLRLLRAMATNLGLQSGGELAGLFEDGTQAMRMNYYPPCAQAEKVMGLAPHSDAVGLTLLLQVNDVPGLQVKKDGMWVPIKPIPGAFVVNVGDIIEIMSNGAYPSIEHRAMVNPNKERLSIAAFHSPKLDTQIGPLPQLLKNRAPKYKTVSSEEYLTLVVTSKLDGKSLMDQIKCIE